LIQTFLELDYEFKVYDHMFMDEFGMSKCTLKCWKQLGNISTIPRNMHEKVWKERENMASLALCKAQSASPRSSEGTCWRSERRAAPRAGLQSPLWGALAGATRHPFPQKTRLFSFIFPTLNLLNFNGSSPKHLES